MCAIVKIRHDGRIWRTTYKPTTDSESERLVVTRPKTRSRFVWQLLPNAATDGRFHSHARKHADAARVGRRAARGGREHDVSVP